MTCLGPRIGEVAAQAGERPDRDHELEYGKRVGLHDADVRQSLAADHGQQVTDTRGMHVDGEDPEYIRRGPRPSPT